MANIKRNDPCPCGSGKKYKNCCFQKNFTKIVPEKIDAQITMDDGSKVTRKVRSIDALPTHNKNGLSPSITPEQMIDLCLDEIYKILINEKVGMLADLTDKVVLDMDIIPTFTYRQISERMSNDSRFEIAKGHICGIKGFDPVGLLANKLECYKK